MATITHGENKRTDVSSRSAPIFSDDATYSRVHTVTIASDEGITYLTGSLSNPSGFMVKTAGQGVLTATDGGDIPAGVTGGFPAVSILRGQNPFPWRHTPFPWGD